jgi:hypothetical protein
MRKCILALALCGLGASLSASLPTAAAPLAISKAAIAGPDTLVVQVRARGGGGGGVAVHRSTTVAAGRHGGAAAVHRSGTVVRGGAVHGGAVVRGGTVVRGGHAVVVRRGAWARPGGYWWPVGGAVAAGAAIGFVTAATAAAWAGPAPGPGMCWYYTDPGRTQGFWDAC